MHLLNTFHPQTTEFPFIDNYYSQYQKLLDRMFDYEKQGLRGTQEFQKMLEIHNLLRPYMRELLKNHKLNQQATSEVAQILGNHWWLINK